MWTQLERQTCDPALRHPTACMCSLIANQADRLLDLFQQLLNTFPRPFSGCFLTGMDGDLLPFPEVSGFCRFLCPFLKAGSVRKSLGCSRRLDLSTFRVSLLAQIWPTVISYKNGGGGGIFLPMEKSSQPGHPIWDQSLPQSPGALTAAPLPVADA